MLNEKNEIEALLKGERINKKYTYRSCYLLAKYFKSLGYDHNKIREEIFAWGRKYEVYITDDLNSIIQRVFKDKKEIAENIEIKISNNDIEEIIKRFDRYNTRLTAFAILCFAKKYANRNGMFYMSRVGLSNWINIKQTNLSNRYIKELIDFNYLEKVTVNDIKLIKINNKKVSKMLIYKIKVNFKNTGEYIVEDYDIRKEFEKIIADYEYYSSVSLNSITK